MKRPKQMSASQAHNHHLMQQIYLQAAQQQGTALSSPRGSGSYKWVATTSTNTTATTAITTIGPTTWTTVDWDDPDYPQLDNTITVKDGQTRIIRLPDGTVIDVEANGSFTINDKDAKVTYRANRVRDFNSFVNASDKLEAFIQFCGQIGVRQGEMLDIPIKHFIAWLIVEAALADGEKPDDIAKLPDLRQHIKPRCKCGRFLSRKHVERKVAFCRTVCLEKQLEAA